MVPGAGAEFEYARHVFPRWLTFLVGWMMAAGLVVAAAAVAPGFAARSAMMMESKSSVVRGRVQQFTAWPPIRAWR